MQEAPVIEWVPRSLGDNGWRGLVAGSYQGHAVLVDQPGGPAVQVPVVVRDWVRIAAERAARRFVLLARLAFFTLFALAWLTQLSVRGVGRLWPVWTAAAVVLAIGAYRFLRLRRWHAGPRADLLLSRDGVAVDDVFVPWYQVEAVVRFHVVAPFERRGNRNFLALRVCDFVAVQGLSPFRAGLANLTRRRLLVLGETTELTHPDELAAALDRLRTDPHARDLLNLAEGVRLADEGPARVLPRSP
jgi:hypothetical protein